MKYVPSIFNYHHECSNGELLLYSSSVGVDSLVQVTSEKSESILRILKNGCNEESDVVKSLLKKGYIVFADTDESATKQFRVMEQVMDSSLHLVLLPTEQCNIRCKYSYESFKKGKMSEVIQESIIKYVKKTYCKIRFNNFLWRVF